jgi:integrase
LYLVLGQRVGEVAGMTKGEVSEKERMWHLTAERTKNGVRHAVPLPDAARELLGPRLRGKGRYIFRDGRTRLRRSLQAHLTRRCSTT